MTNTKADTAPVSVLIRRPSRIKCLQQQVKAHFKEPHLYHRQFERFGKVDAFAINKRTVHKVNWFGTKFKRAEPIFSSRRFSYSHHFLAFAAITMIEGFDVQANKLCIFKNHLD